MSLHSNDYWVRLIHLVEVSQIGDLVPKTAHYVLIFGQLGWTAFAFAFDDARTQCHAFEVALVQEAVVINICFRTSNTSPLHSIQIESAKLDVKGNDEMDDACASSCGISN